MITTTEFSIQLARLEKEFMHNAKYSEEKSKIFYDEVKFLKSEHLVRAVNFLIGENRYSPNLSDLKKAIDATKQSSDADRDRFGAKNDNKCFWCGNLGSVAVLDVSYKDDFLWPHGFHKGKPHLTNATCDCDSEATKLRRRNNPDISCLVDMNKYQFYKLDFERTGIYTFAGHKIMDYC